MPGMQDFTGGMQEWCLRAPPAAEVHIAAGQCPCARQCLAEQAGVLPAGAWAGCRVLLCEWWGRAPSAGGKNSRVGLAPGPAQENAPSWLWDSLDDFNECFFPFLSKPEEEVPRAPCRAPFVLSSSPP